MKADEQDLSDEEIAYFEKRFRPAALFCRRAFDKLELLHSREFNGPSPSEQQKAY